MYILLQPSGNYGSSYNFFFLKKKEFYTRCITQGSKRWKKNPFGDALNVYIFV